MISKQQHTNQCDLKDGRFLATKLKHYMPKITLIQKSRICFLLFTKPSVCRFKSSPYQRHLVALLAFAGQLAGASASCTTCKRQKCRQMALIRLTLKSTDNGNQPYSSKKILCAHCIDRGHYHFYFKPCQVQKLGSFWWLQSKVQTCQTFRISGYQSRKKNLGKIEKYRV